MKPENEPRKLLEGKPIVVNLGIQGFAMSLRKQKVRVIHVNWSPPRALDPEIEDLLSRLI